MPKQKTQRQPATKSVRLISSIHGRLEKLAADTSYGNAERLANIACQSLLVMAEDEGMGVSFPSYLKRVEESI